MTEKTEICTLRVLHLPPSLSNEKREELFKHYGATKTTTIRKSEKYTITFVEFPSKELTDQAFFRLHQLPVKGQRLSIEHAKRNISVDDKENTIHDSGSTEKEKELENSKIQFQAFMKKLNTWAPHHILTQPIPPNLRYKYPAPTRNTLLRIAIQLVKEPAFYTQVLHLMNRMCLPPPFEELEEFSTVKEAYDIENYQDLFGFRTESQHAEAPKEQENQNEEENQEPEDDDEEESEIESDKETVNQPQPIIPQKRKLNQSKKRLKIPKFVNPLKQPVAASTSQKQKRSEVFELQRRDPRNRTIVLKPLEPTSKIAESTSKVEEKAKFVVEPKGNVEGFGLIFPSKKDETEEETKEEKQEFITTEQLHDNRISTNDQRVLPVFNNYHPGKPSCRLYIKNLAKQVEESDLHFIYRRYVLPSTKKDDSEYNVRLMKEGRMKGQAFVTLPNIAQAELALNETNGYILKDKPMVVQFAKVPKS